MILLCTCAGLVVGGSFGYIAARIEDAHTGLHSVLWGDGTRDPSLLTPPGLDTPGGE